MPVRPRRHRAYGIAARSFLRFGKNYFRDAPDGWSADPSPDALREMHAAWRQYENEILDHVGGDPFKIWFYREFLS